jgi:ferredoxin
LHGSKINLLRTIKKHLIGGPVENRLAKTVRDGHIFISIFNSIQPIKFMADTANKYAENIAGKYYVDNQCIDCDLCRETAPDNFKRNEDGGYSFVFKQPASPDEEARCKEAKEACPVEAIGDNGA